ncbi:hypothetical protein CGC20_12975 [Leishmania donovani]|uniref:Uncharacterized protein n=1 Tax=Leishmania donovani TaxID=5661 RepID=A0A504X2T7_LEIDO|nr:hypothetical protein CGC20_12975 [Leishmania donovani]
MKHGKQTAAAARTGTQSASSGVSVLQSLQNENDALRSELLRVKQHKAHMQRQLHDLRAVAERTAREAAMSGKEQVRALEERCRLLADRLVGSKREEQVTETARVGFLLRSQIEERRFLKRGLEAMQEVLANVDGSAASVSRIDHPSTNASTHPEGKEPEGEVHTGDLHRLMMTVSGSLHAHTASAKLEKARIRLTLEQAASLVDELHDAVEDAARAAFDAAVQANVACDAGTTSPAGGDVFQLSSVLMVPCGAPASAVQNASSFTPAHRRGGGHDGYLAGSADAASSLRHQGAGAFPLAYSLMTPPSSAQLGLELEWVCDVLKACMKGAAEVRALIGAAAEGLRAPLPLLQRRCDAGDRSSTTEQAPPLASAASPEMNALLRSFLEDLWTLKQQAARQQEDMARQLAQEVERHFQSTQQYEQRVKLLEAECARLLFYVERQATQRPGVDATTQTSSRQNATVSETLMPALVPVQDTPVTPERYVASRDVAKLSERRSARPPRKPPPHHGGNDPARANRDTTSYYFQKGLSFSQPSSPSKPSRATAPNAPSPAASAIRSAYGDQKSLSAAALDDGVYAVAIARHGTVSCRLLDSNAFLCVVYIQKTFSTRPAITAAAVPRDSTPSPSGTSVATPRPGRETSRHCTHLSQQIYSEAAADVFSFHSTTFGGAPSALSSVRHLQSESSRMSDVGSTAEVQTPSPRRPVRLSLYLNRASPGEAAVLRTARQLHTPPSPVSAVLSGHVLGDDSTVGISRQAETPSTPPIWRRIKEEASFQRQHLPSPIAGGDASSLFGTPHEVPWTNA